MLMDMQVKDTTPLTLDQLETHILAVSCGIRSAFEIGQLIDDNKYTTKGCYAFNLYNKVSQEVSKLPNVPSIQETFSICGATSKQIISEFPALQCIRAELNSNITTMILGMLDQRALLSHIDIRKDKHKDLFSDVTTLQHMIVNEHNPLDAKLTRLGELSPYKAGQMQLVQNIVDGR